MSNIRYYNQTGPFWDFIASLEDTDWANHPLYQAFIANNNQGRNNNSNTNANAGATHEEEQEQAAAGPSEGHNDTDRNMPSDAEDPEASVPTEWDAFASGFPFAGFGAGFPFNGRRGGRGGHGRGRGGFGGPGFGGPHRGEFWGGPHARPGHGPHGPGPHRGPPPPPGPPGSPPPPGHDTGMPLPPPPPHSPHHGEDRPSTPPTPDHDDEPEEHRHEHHRHGHGRMHGGPGGRGRGGHGGHGGRGRHGGHGHGPWGGSFNMNQLAEFFQEQIFGQDNIGRQNSTNANGDFTPPVDVFDTESSFVVDFSVPGTKKSDIAVSWDAETSELCMTGFRHRFGDEEFLKTLVIGERKVGAFSRKVRLGNRAAPARVDAEGISAKLEEGVLRVVVPKEEKEFEVVHRIEIV